MLAVVMEGAGSGGGSASFAAAARPSVFAPDFGLCDETDLRMLAQDACLPAITGNLGCPAGPDSGT